MESASWADVCGMKMCCGAVLPVPHCKLIFLVFPEIPGTGLSPTCQPCQEPIPSLASDPVLWVHEVPLPAPSASLARAAIALNSWKMNGGRQLVLGHSNFCWCQSFLCRRANGFEISLGWFWSDVISPVVISDSKEAQCYY